MNRHTVRLDVSASSGIASADLAATIAFDDPGPNPIVTVMLPGGGYSRGYWDIDWPGGYSQAQFHAERGWIVVALDHLGVGDSFQPDPETITFDQLAATTAEAVSTLRSRLASGTLAPGLAQVDPAAVIGVGQSMGGCVTVIAQAQHQPFDGIAILGFSAVHTVLATPSGGAHVDDVSAESATAETLRARAEELSVADVFSYAFHWNVESALLQADLGDGFPFRLGTVPPWGSASVPPVAVAMLSAGVVAEEAAAVTVPVFVGAGERDVCPNPAAEPAAYPSSSGVTLSVVPGMAHMHNFDAGREHLWRDLQRWATEVTKP